MTTIVAPRPAARPAARRSVSRRSVSRRSDSSPLLTWALWGLAVILALLAALTIPGLLQAVGVVVAAIGMVVLAAGLVLRP